MVQVASLLLIYLKPGEVYNVLVRMINDSITAFSTADTKALIRWHFTMDKQDYFKLLTMFVKSYLNTTMRKKRSLLKHLNKIGF
jgi:hypothetical protein